jgi:signal transduction histidine kinase
VRLTPRELATRAFALTVLAAGWTATALVWPDRGMTRGEAVTLGGCVLASAWLLRHGVRLSAPDHYITLEDLVLVPLVLVYPVGWVMAVGAASSLGWLWSTRSWRTPWYRTAFNTGIQPLLALASSSAAGSVPGDGAARVGLAAVAASLTWVALSGVGSTGAGFLERGGALAEHFSVGDVIAQLRSVPVMVAFAVLVYQGRSADWPVLVAAGLVVLVQQLLGRGAHADVIAAEQKAEREQLLGLVVGIGDRKRREVTSQIHDGPLQVVVATKMLLDAMTNRRESGATADRDQIKALSQHLTGAIDDLRSTLHEGYRDQLVVAGVRDGLTEILREHQARFRRGFELVVDDRLDLSVDTSVALLLILREAIVNAAKHSRGQSVAVSVCADGTTVVGEVLDDGVGIERSLISVRRKRGHLGIALMHERAERAGGTATVGRRETRGTRVRVTLPMSPTDVPPLEDWERAPNPQPAP